MAADLDFWGQKEDRQNFSAQPEHWLGLTTTPSQREKLLLVPGCGAYTGFSTITQPIFTIQAYLYRRMSEKVNGRKVLAEHGGFLPETM